MQEFIFLKIFYGYGFRGSGDLGWSSFVPSVVLGRLHIFAELQAPLQEAVVCGLGRSQSIAKALIPPVWSFVISNDDSPTVHPVQNEDKLN